MRCRAEVRWVDIGWVRMHCRLEESHGGPHWDGACWFDDQGYRVPREQRPMFEVGG